MGQSIPISMDFEHTGSPKNMSDSNRVHNCKISITNNDNDTSKKKLMVLTPTPCKKEFIINELKQYAYVIYWKSSSGIGNSICGITKPIIGKLELGNNYPLVINGHTFNFRTIKINNRRIGTMIDKTYCVIVVQDDTRITLIPEKLLH